MTDYASALNPQYRHLVRTSLHPIDVAQELQLKLEPSPIPHASPWKVYVATELADHFRETFSGDFLGSLTQHWTGLPNVDVFVVPRRKELRAWVGLSRYKEAEHPGAWSTRGWAECFLRPRARVFLLGDPRTETPESMGWLLVHEVTHVAVAAQGWLPYALALCRDARGIFHDYDQKDGATHNAVPEEELCNATATQALGADYGSAWWQARRVSQLVVPAAV